MHSGAAVTSCEHCGRATAEGSTFCCLGCETVGALLSERGLTRYYALGGRTNVPASAPVARDHLWLAPLLARLRSGATPRHVALDVQGLRCAACTWLLEETFRRMAGGRRVLVDPGVGRIELWVEADFDLAALEELAIDPRAFDFLHPAASRPNYLFGLWDPSRIDEQGLYRRMVVQQATLRVL